MLKNNAGELILSAVREHIKSYPFPILDDGVSIMSGEDEGVFAWIVIRNNFRL
jgi:guanosine-diphosphatase